MSSACVALLLAATVSAERYELLVSPTFGEEAGIRTLDSARQVLFLYDDALSARLDFDESTAPRRLLGFAGRLAKLLLFDAPLVELLVVFEHEVFGHGARAREQGVWPEYSFGLPMPYSWVLSPSQRFSGFALYQSVGIVDHDLPVTLAGMEVELLAAHYGTLRALRAGGRMHFAAAIAHFIRKVTYLPSWVGPQMLGNVEEGDVDAYAVGLDARFNRWGHEAQLDTSQRLRRAYVTNFLDPVLWLSLWHMVVDYLAYGERVSTLPQLHVPGARLFATTRFNVSPFGAEHYLDVFVSTDTLLIDVWVRGVSTGFASSYGLGARLFQWQVRPWLELGGSLDVWAQPELLPQYRNAFDGRTLPGISGMLEATWRPFAHWAFVAQLGGKSSGYVMGQPLAAGLFGFAGVALFPDVQP